LDNELSSPSCGERKALSHSVRQRTDRALSDQYPAVSICDSLPRAKGKVMNSIIYIVGLVVIIAAVLSYFGFR
jgi:hypothetical protein